MPSDPRLLQTLNKEEEGTPLCWWCESPERSPRSTHSSHAADPRREYDRKVQRVQLALPGWAKYPGGQGSHDDWDSSGTLPA